MEQVTVTIPDDIFEWEARDIARELLERAALEAYRAEVISVGRMAEILGFSIDEAHGFLKLNETPINLSDKDIEQGEKALESLSGRQ
ncbi:MAG: UPF0175 family protein [Blastocatellia bacterium]|nr:UPF0175 family protein [Blastocatellia bacterium]